MKIQTFTVVAGTEACNARCPFCVSKMTQPQCMAAPDEVNWRNFDVACKFALMNNVSTVLITGKGEPTLHPELLSEYIARSSQAGFPFIELQTNGKTIEKDVENIYHWYDLGLTTVALSVVHYNQERNAEIYGGNHYDLGKTIEKLHGAGLSVRLCVMLVKGYIDTPQEIDKLIHFSQAYGVEQLSVRPIATPTRSFNKEAKQWTEQHSPAKEDVNRIIRHVQMKGDKIMSLPHGASVYDVKGQNLCLTDCLTIQPETDEIRQLIFFPDGHLKYDWTFKGATLL